MKSKLNLNSLLLKVLISLLTATLFSNCKQPDPSIKLFGKWSFTSTYECDDPIETSKMKTSMKDMNYDHVNVEFGIDNKYYMTVPDHPTATGYYRIKKDSLIFDINEVRTSLRIVNFSSSAFDATFTQKTSKNEFCVITEHFTKYKPLQEVKKDEDGNIKPQEFTCEDSEFGVVIQGNNVRVRSEPDVSKDNILMLLNKGVETIYLDDTKVGDQIWYKICYNQKVGWVSGEFATFLD